MSVTPVFLFGQVALLPEFPTYATSQIFLTLPPFTCIPHLASYDFTVRALR